MKPPGYTRHKRTYTFRAWIDERGCNADREHEWCPVFPERRCRHRWLWDWNTRPGSKNIVRVIRGRRYLSIRVGPRYWGFG